MAGEIITRDSNFRTIGAGIDPNDPTDIQMLRIDPVTKYLLLNIAGSSVTSANTVQIAQRDQNFRTVCMGWDDTNKVLQEILTDSNGNLLVQFD